MDMFKPEDYEYVLKEDDLAHAQEYVTYHFNVDESLTLKKYWTSYIGLTVREMLEDLKKEVGWNWAEKLPSITLQVVQWPYESYVHAISMPTLEKLILYHFFPSHIGKKKDATSKAWVDMSTVELGGYKELFGLTMKDALKKIQDENMYHWDRPLPETKEEAEGIAKTLQEWQYNTASFLEIADEVFQAGSGPPIITALKEKTDPTKNAYGLLLKPDTHERFRRLFFHHFWGHWSFNWKEDYEEWTSAQYEEHSSRKAYEKATAKYDGKTIREAIEGSQRDNDYVWLHSKPTTTKEEEEMTAQLIGTKVIIEVVNRTIPEDAKVVQVRPVSGLFHVQGKGVTINRNYGVSTDFTAQLAQKWLEEQETTEDSLTGSGNKYVPARAFVEDDQLYVLVEGEVLNHEEGALLAVDGCEELRQFVTGVLVVDEDEF